MSKSARMAAVRRAYDDHAARTVQSARPASLSVDDLRARLPFTDGHNGDAGMIEAAVYDALTMESPGYVGAVHASYGSVTFVHADYTCVLNVSKRTIQFSPSWVPHYDKERTPSTYAPPRGIVRGLEYNGVFLTGSTKWDREVWQDRAQGASEMYAAAITCGWYGGWINITPWHGLVPITIDNKGDIAAYELQHGRTRRVTIAPLDKGKTSPKIIGLVPKSFETMVPLDFAVGSREPARLQRGATAAMAALGFNANVRKDCLLLGAEPSRDGGAYRRLVDAPQYGATEGADPLMWWTHAAQVKMVPLPLARAAQMGSWEKSTAGAKKIGKEAILEPSQEWSDRYQKMLAAWRHFADKGWIFTPDFERPSLLYWGPDRRVHIVIRFGHTYPQAWTGVPVWEVDADLRVAVMKFTNQPELTQSPD